MSAAVRRSEPLMHCRTLWWTITRLWRTQGPEKSRNIWGSSGYIHKFNSFLMICKRCVSGENEPRQVDIDVAAVSGSIRHHVNYCLIELNRVNYLLFEVELTPFTIISTPLTLHPHVVKKVMPLVPLDQFLSKKMNNCPTVSFMVPQADTLFEAKLSPLKNRNTRTLSNLIKSHTTSAIYLYPGVRFPQRKFSRHNTCVSNVSLDLDLL